MLNARNSLASPLLAVVALLALPFGALAGDDDAQAAPALDLNARLQQKLSAKLNGQIDDAEANPANSLDDKLSSRVQEQNAEAAQQLEEQASTLTSADRSSETEDKEKVEAATEATARQ